MKKVLSDILDITVALIQTVAVLSYAKIMSMSTKRRIAFYIFAAVAFCCVVRLINWHNVGGEAILLAGIWTYLYATRPREEGTFYDKDM